MSPAWLLIAAKYLGVAETPGPKSTSKIMQWVKSVGRYMGLAYTDDDTPWCGLFVANCMVEAGIEPPKIAVRASSWITWGDPLARPVEGAVLVFQRPGGGHVGFYAGENATAYYVLGGNQGNRVSYTWVAKARCVAIRWPLGVARNQRQIAVNQTGALSRDEA